MAKFLATEEIYVFSTEELNSLYSIPELFHQFQSL
jgi:hypothetical protein